jgi:hypothetical protein
VQNVAIKKHRIEGVLVSYYGILQISHLTALVVSGVWMLRHGELGVLALPPQGGWTDQALQFLLATGMFDFLIAICSLFFVFLYRKQHRLTDILGSVALTGSVYSAVVYAFGVLRSGAVSEHPLIYGLIAVLFSPMIVLAVIFLARRLFFKSV